MWVWFTAENLDLGHLNSFPAPLAYNCFYQFVGRRLQHYSAGKVPKRGSFTSQTLNCSRSEFSPGFMMLSE